MTAAAQKTADAQVEYKMFDVVVARVDVPHVSGRTVPAGTAGTIIEIFDTPWRGYMVEFPEDEEMSLPVLKPEQIAPWTPPKAKKAA